MRRSSARQVRANRINAQASTGPRTARGKARSKQNAWRHGLSLSVLADPGLAAEVEAMARRIAGDNANGLLLEIARRIAEAQVDLLRVRRARHLLIIGALADPAFSIANEETRAIENAQRVIRAYAAYKAGTDQANNNQPVSASPAARLATVVCDAARELALLDRYERRALSRRKFAIREFDAANSVPDKAG